MATRVQKVWYVAYDDLKTTYQHQGNRINAICKAIGDSTHTQIATQVARNGTVRFEVIGHRVKGAVEQILNEFCKHSSVEKYFKETGVTKRQPTVQLSQEAVQVLSESDQEKLIHEGNRCLLTKEALRKFDLLTGALVLREFACRDCDYFWWKTVPRTKLVAKCPSCSIKYDALPREKEFGTGRYKCTNCSRSFFARCEATSEDTCVKCGSTVRAPYIHPKFISRRPISYRQPVEQLEPYTRVINASTVHDSTGSTASSFISQSGIPVFRVHRLPRNVPTNSENDDKDSVIYDSSSEFESDSEQSSELRESEAELSTSDTESSSGVVGGSDSSSDSDDTDDQVLPQKRSSASSSSDSDSDSDDKDKGKTQKGQSKPTSVSFEKQSTHSAGSDSGHGTAGETGSSTATKSSGGSEQGSVPSVTLGSIVAFNMDFPGIVFSKHCAEKIVDSNGATVIGEGIQLDIPEFAIVSGDSVEIALQACLGGPFLLPSDITLASPVYRIAPPCAFRHDVVLTIEHFAQLESASDCEDIVFITSPTKPEIRKVANWKFHVYDQARLECELRGQKVKLHLRHFCLGAIGRRKRNGQKYRYCTCLHSPLNYIPPRCNAIFSVTLHHEVYVQNLERYLEKTFQEQTFLATAKIVRSTENEIELVLPTELAQTQGYKLLNHTECRIQKEEVDYGLKLRGRTQSEIMGYPPRIVLTLCQLNPSSNPTLECRIDINGIREFPYVNLHVLPPAIPFSRSHSEGSDRSSSTSSEHEEANELQMGDLYDIATYLKKLNTSQLKSLGYALGLHHPKVSRMDPEHLHFDLVAAWLKREDDVRTRCPPTWSNLVTTLRVNGDSGVAYTVERERLAQS